jgi:hypothetical protein
MRHRSIHGVGQKAKAIERGGITINDIDNQTFDFIINILADMKYDIKERSASVLERVMGSQLTSLIGKLGPKEIDSLYPVVHFLDIRNLLFSIAAVITCHVYIRPTLADSKKETELGMRQKLITKISKISKKRF